MNVYLSLFHAFAINSFQIHFQLQDLQTIGDLANGDISNSSTDSSTQATSSQIVSLNSIEVEPFVADG